MRWRKALFYVLLGAATLGLSEFLAAWRAWRAAPAPEHAVQVAVLGLGLLGLGLWLGFLLYEVDRAAGRVRRPIRLYEWIIATRAAGTGRGRGAPHMGVRAAAPPARGRG